MRLMCTVSSPALSGPEVDSEPLKIKASIPEARIFRSPCLFLGPLFYVYNVNICMCIHVLK